MRGEWGEREETKILKKVPKDGSTREGEKERGGNEGKMEGRKEGHSHRHTHTCTHVGVAQGK